MCAQYVGVSCTLYVHIRLLLKNGCAEMCASAFAHKRMCREKWMCSIKLSIHMPCNILCDVTSHVWEHLILSLCVPHKCDVIMKTGCADRHGCEACIQCDTHNLNVHGVVDVKHWQSVHCGVCVCVQIWFKMCAT